MLVSLSGFGLGPTHAGGFRLLQTGVSTPGIGLGDFGDRLYGTL
jgi:hypothetical protein